LSGAIPLLWSAVVTVRVAQRHARARILAESFAELLHAAVEIDANGTMREPGACRDLRTGHAFHEAEDERFTIGLRKTLDNGENGFCLRLLRVSFRRDFGLFLGETLRFRVRSPGVPMEIIGAVTCDGGQPPSKVGDVAQGVKLRKRAQENILDKIVQLAGRDTRQEYAVDHARVPSIETTERGSIAFARGTDERCVVSSSAGRPQIHGPTVHDCGAQVNPGTHGSAIERRNLS